MTTYLEIPLTQGLFAVVDAPDESLVVPFKWYAAKKPSTAYAQRTIRVDGKWTTQMMHSLLTGWSVVDHINGNGLDNRRANLRPATAQQNGFNRRAITGSSSFKGVYLHGDKRRWRAQIGVNGVRHHLGLFTDEVDAAKAYDAAAREVFGEFAVLNFPESQ